MVQSFLEGILLGGVEGANKRHPMFLEGNLVGERELKKKTHVGKLPIF